MSPIIVPASREHVAAIAERVRHADAVEVEALGLTPRAAIELSLDHSLCAWTWIEEDAPACIWGVTAQTILGATGCPWLITTDLVQRYPMRFLRGSRNALERMQAMFPRLENYVDARYAVCVRWLRWLGFEIWAAQPFGPMRLPFHRFTMGA